MLLIFALLTGHVQIGRRTFVVNEVVITTGKNGALVRRRILLTCPY